MEPKPTTEKVSSYKELLRRFAGIWARLTRSRRARQPSLPSPQTSPDFGPVLKVDGYDSFKRLVYRYYKKCGEAISMEYRCCIFFLNYKISGREHMSIIHAPTSQDIAGKLEIDGFMTYSDTAAGREYTIHTDKIAEYISNNLWTARLRTHVWQILTAAVTAVIVTLITGVFAGGTDREAVHSLSKKVAALEQMQHSPPIMLSTRQPTSQSASQPTTTP